MTDRARDLVELMATSKSHNQKQSQVKKALLQDMLGKDMSELRAEGVLFSVERRNKLAPVNLKNLLTWGEAYQKGPGSNGFQMPEFLEWVKKTRQRDAEPAEPSLKVTVES